MPGKGQKDMRSFFHKQPTKRHPAYNPAEKTPVIRCSICTGEQVAGFKNIHTGQFTECMLIRNDADLQVFKDTYGVTKLSKEY